jgi:hypothetical protein
MEINKNNNAVSILMSEGFGINIGNSAKTNVLALIAN